MRKMLAVLVVLLFVASNFATAVAQNATDGNETEHQETVEPEEQPEGQSESGLEIEAETEDGTTKVKVDVNDSKIEFTLDTNNRDIIIEEIAAKTGLSTEQVKKVIKFELEFKKKIRDIDFPVKKRSVVYQLKKHLIGMDAVIGFATELNMSTARLEELRSDFNAEIENIEQLSSSGEKDPLGRHVAEARRIANEFRQASHELLGDEVGAARERVKEAIAEDKDGILAEEADKNRAEQGSHGLKSFDSHVENAQRKIDRLANAGYNVDAAQEKLDEIADKRPALVEATEAFINSCLGKPLKCDNAEHERLKELRKEIREEFKELNEIIKKIRQAERIAHLIAKLESAIDRAENRLAKAEEKGMDVTVYKAKLEEIKNILDGANSKAEAGDIKGAVADIRAGHVALTNVLKELAKERRAFLKELREKKKIEKFKELAGKPERALERAEKLIADAEEKGLDVTVYRSKLQEIRENLAAASEKAEAGDVKGATADLRSANAALTKVLRDLAKDRRELLKQHREKKKIEKAREKQEEAAEKATEKIEKAREKQKEAAEKAAEKKEEREEGGGRGR